MENKEIRGMTEVANRLVKLYKAYLKKGQSAFLGEYTELVKTATNIDLLYFAANCPNESNAIEAYLKVREKRLINKFPEYVEYNISINVERSQRIEELRISKILPN